MNDLNSTFLEDTNFLAKLEEQLHKNLVGGTEF